MEKMVRVLVSACLMGEPVRYDGKIVSLHDRILHRWQREGRIVSFCPEVAAGLPVPRPPSEIRKGRGIDVVGGTAAVFNVHGEDLTEIFIHGARKALELVHDNGIRLAVLKDGSPSCGSTYIYDGSFSGRSRPGKGSTAALLEEEGIRVFNEQSIPQAAALLGVFEGPGGESAESIRSR